MSFSCYPHGRFAGLTVEFATPWKSPCLGGGLFFSHSSISSVMVVLALFDHDQQLAALVDRLGDVSIFRFSPPSWLRGPSSCARCRCDKDAVPRVLVFSTGSGQVLQIVFHEVIHELRQLICGVFRLIILAVHFGCPQPGDADRGFDAFVDVRGGVKPSRAMTCNRVIPGRPCPSCSGARHTPGRVTASRRTTR